MIISNYFFVGLIIKKIVLNCYTAALFGQYFYATEMIRLNGENFKIILWVFLTRFSQIQPIKILRYVTNFDRNR